MRKVKTFKSAAFPLQSAVILHDKEWEEYRVQFFLDGAHLVTSDYHAADKADALETAKTAIERELVPLDVNRTVSIGIPDQMARDILTTACEGGSNYWGEFETVANHRGENGLEWSEVIVRDTEDEDREDMRAGIETIRAGIRKAIASPNSCAAHIRAAIGSAIMTGEASDIDADCADVILQLGLFGEIVYG